MKYPMAEYVMFAAVIFCGHETDTPVNNRVWGKGQ